MEPVINLICFLSLPSFLFFFLPPQLLDGFLQIIYRLRNHAREYFARVQDLLTSRLNYLLNFLFSFLLQIRNFNNQNKIFLTK